MKKWTAAIWNGIKGAGTEFGGYLKRNWEKTDKGLYLVVTVLVCFLSGIGMSQLFPQTVPAFVIGILLAFIISSLAVPLISWLIRQILKLGIRNLIYMVLIISISASLATRGSIGSSETASVIIGALFGVIMIILGSSLWAFFHNRVHTPTIIISLMLSAAVFIGGCVLIASSGFKDMYIEKYLRLNPKVQRAQEITEFQEQMQQGDYTVETLEYSPVKDVELESGTIDLSFCVAEPDGLEGIRRKHFFGYDVENAAIAGKVWYPKEVSGCPVVFLIHGNHSILTESYLGYDYLGEYLASYGYVVVSVDENVLNGLSNENDARAILLLENIRKLQQYNNQEENPLYGKMDYDRIALAGHSRGGEAVATACLFNGYDYYPENGMFDFQYHFNIRSVIAIAPTVNQYMPADHVVELQDVNYLQLQGANDQDVSENMGTTQYSHVTFTGAGEYIKSTLYIAGANHGQFNSLWGRFDLPEPAASFLNVKNFITTEEQQSILKICAKVFLDKTLENTDTYADLLTDYAKYSACLPETIYVQQYQKSDADIFCDYEEDSNLHTATDANVKLSAQHMSTWTEEMSRYSEQSGGARGNYVLRLKWRNTDDASYHLTFTEPVSLTDKNLAFDICNMEEEDGSDDQGKTVEPVLEITDVNGNTAYLNTADYVTVYPSLPVRLGKLQYLTGTIVYKHEYQTICVPTADFTSEERTVDLSQIRKITIAFPEDESGKVGIDNICLE